MSDPLQGSNGPDLTLGTPVDSLADGVPLLGHVGSSAIILVRRADAISAIGATCRHYGGPLAEGLVVDDTVRCPWHHACFSLRTGEALRAPALDPVPCYAVVERDGRVFVTGKLAAPGSVRRRVPRGTPLPRSVAIVGAGAAGNSAAEELRHLGFDGAITLIDQDREAPYDRPNLSKDYLAGTAPQEWLPLHPRAYYEERGVELALGRRITALDPAPQAPDVGRRNNGRVRRDRSRAGRRADPARHRRRRSAYSLPAHAGGQPRHHQGGRGSAAGGGPWSELHRARGRGLPPRQEDRRARGRPGAAPAGARSGRRAR